MRFAKKSSGEKILSIQHLEDELSILVWGVNYYWKRTTGRQNDASWIKKQYAQNKRYVGVYRKRKTIQIIIPKMQKRVRFVVRPTLYNGHFALHGATYNTHTHILASTKLGNMKKERKKERTYWLPLITQ